MKKNNKLTAVSLILADLIKENSKVLDVGCGSGELLQHLKTYKNISGRGIEIDNHLVSKALKRGLAVMQGDADNDLEHYPSNSFDYVILSQTLQVTKSPHLVLKELKRIAKFVLVSVPNFGYYENRIYLAVRGKMPVTKTLSYEWYNTPNIHFCTIKDFKNLSRELDFIIEKEIYINDELPFFNILKFNNFFNNLFAKYGIFLLKRGETVKKPHINSRKINIDDKVGFSAC